MDHQCVVYGKVLKHESWLTFCLFSFYTVVVIVAMTSLVCACETGLDRISRWILLRNVPRVEAQDQFNVCYFLLILTCL